MIRMAENLIPADPLFLDAVEEALSRPRPEGGQQTVRKANRRRRTYDIAKVQLKIVERQQRELARSLRPNRNDLCQECERAKRISPEKMPAIVQASESVTKQIVSLVASIRDAHKAEKDAMASLEEDQLRKVIKAQILRLDISDVEWSAILTEKFGPHVAEVLMRGSK